MNREERVVERGESNLHSWFVYSQRPSKADMTRTNMGPMCLSKVLRHDGELDSVCTCGGGGSRFPLHSETRPHRSIWSPMPGPKLARVFHLSAECWQAGSNGRTDGKWKVVLKWWPQRTLLLFPCPRLTFCLFLFTFSFALHFLITN